jgi:hypothetical protein
MSLNHQHLLVDYGRRTYVFGLPWFTVLEEDVPKKSASETIRRSQRSFDLQLLKNDESPQFALANKASDIKPGAISAAAVLSSTMGNDGWLYALEIEDHVWICNGKDGYILPDGDRVFSDPQAAKDEFLRLEPNRWKSIHVPAAWKAPGAFPEERQKFFASDEVLVSDVSDLFTVSPKGWMRLTGLSPIIGAAKIAAPLGALALAAYFGIGLLMPAPEVAPQVDQEKLKQLLAERARAEQQDQYRKLDSQRPWTSLPIASRYANTCIGAIERLPAAAAGYEAMSITCRDTNVTAELQKGPETYALWLHEWAKDQNEFEIDIAQGGEHAYVVADIPKLPSRGPESLSNYSFVSNVLNEAAAISGSDLKISDPVVYQYEEYPDYVPIYGTSEIDILTDEPSAWINTFNKIGGVQISKVSLNPKTMNYNFKGRIYVSNR